MAGAVIAAAVVIPLLVLGGASQKAVAANSIVALDPSGSIAATVPVGARPAVESRSGLVLVGVDDGDVIGDAGRARDPVVAVLELEWNTDQIDNDSMVSSRHVSESNVPWGPRCVCRANQAVEHSLQW